MGIPYDHRLCREVAARINDSIKAAKEAEAKLRGLAEDQSRMIEETRQEQSRILKEAAASRDTIVSEAKVQARDEASRILAERTQIAAEKESALRDVRREVALLSVSVAEKVLKQNLSDADGQSALVDRLVDEVSSSKDLKN